MAAPTSPLGRTLSPELRLLLLAAGGPGNDAAIAAIASQPLDWQRLGVLSDIERATRPLLRRLDAVAPGTMPAPMRQGLQRLAMVSDFEMGLLQGMVARLLARLQAERIDAIPLKGAAIAMRYLGGFADRPMRDIDLLLPRPALVRARAIALEEGWRPDPAGHSDAVYVEHAHLAPLVDARGTGLRLELHGDLFGEGHPFRFGADAVRTAARPTPWAGLTVPIPSASHLMLHASLHLAWSHALASGAWRTFRDLELILANETIDWPAFVGEATSARAASSVYWTLRLARELSGTAVPAEPLAALQPPGPRWVHGLTARHVASHMSELEASCPSLRLRQFAWRVALRPAWSGHRQARPWARNEAFIAQPAPAGGPFSKIAHHLRLWSQYVAYARRLFGGAPRAGSGA